MDKIVSLKKSRDRLLAQLDGQSLDLEQLLAENQAVQQQSAAAQQESRNWQAQAQDALVTVSRLQEMLAGDAAAAAAAAAPEAVSGDGGDGADPGGAGALCPAAGGELEQLRGTLAQQHAKVAALELQVSVLAVQLLRSHAACGRVSRSLLPLLGGVEARLLGLKARTAGALKAGAAQE